MNRTIGRTTLVLVGAAVSGTLAGHLVSSILLLFLCLFVFDIPTAPQTAYGVLLVAVSNGTILILQSVLSATSLSLSLWTRRDRTDFCAIVLGCLVYCALMWGGNRLAEIALVMTLRPLWVLRYIYLPITALGVTNDLLETGKYPSKLRKASSVLVQTAAGAVSLVLVLFYTGRGMDIIALNVLCFVPTYVGLAAGLTIAQRWPRSGQPA